MRPSGLERAEHIKHAIATLRQEVGSSSLETLIANPLQWAGFKYLLLIISEAARNLPVEWRNRFGPGIDWRNVANLGNILRHGYHGANATTLWSIYVNDLGPLEAAIDAMIAADGAKGGG